MLTKYGSSARAVSMFAEDGATESIARKSTFYDHVSQIEHDSFDLIDWWEI